MVAGCGVMFLYALPFASVWNEYTACLNCLITNEKYNATVVAAINADLTEFARDSCGGVTSTSALESGIPVSSTASASASASASNPVSSIAGSTKSSVGAIAGGVVGGIVGGIVLAGLLFILWVRRRRKARKDRSTFVEDQSVRATPFNGGITPRLATQPGAHPSGRGEDAAQPLLSSTSQSSVPPMGPSKSAMAAAERRSRPAQAPPVVGPSTLHAEEEVEKLPPMYNPAWADELDDSNGREASRELR